MLGGGGSMMTRSSVTFGAAELGCDGDDGEFEGVGEVERFEGAGTQRSKWNWLSMSDW